MKRRSVGTIAVVSGFVLLFLAMLGGFLFGRLVTEPPATVPPGQVVKAFVSALFFFATGWFLVVAGRAWQRDPHEGFAAPDRFDIPQSAAPASDGSPPRAIAPVAVPPEEVELEEGPVTACLRCGSMKVRPLTLGDGLAVGSETLASICARCRWRGVALAFDDPTAYRAFIIGLHEEARERARPSSDPNLRR